MRIRILFFGSLAILLLVVQATGGTAAKIAQKLAPGDATGDLDKVEGESRPPRPSPTPREMISEIQLLTLPKGKPILKESEEPAKPLNLLENPQVRRILRPQPSFIYDPGELRDPMIVPWVRHTILVREFLQNLQKLIKEKKITQAKSLIKQIEEILPDVTNLEMRNNASAQLAIIKQKLASAEAVPGEIATEAAPTPIPTPVIHIPAWIKTHVGGVIWAPRSQDRMVLIGDEILKEGQKIPKYPDAVIQKINPTTVIISYRGLAVEVAVAREE